jgi:hypothetical protein
MSKAITISDLFDQHGNCLNSKSTYFSIDGDLLNQYMISQEYKKYPAGSDIVKMYYSDAFADETHGNYVASTLFFRAF